MRLPCPRVEGDLGAAFGENETKTDGRAKAGHLVSNNAVTAGAARPSEASHVTVANETAVSAQTPVVLTTPPPPVAPAPDHVRAARVQKHGEEVARWREIDEAGGAEAWVETRLRAAGFPTDSVDTSKLSDKERAHYKERKKAEALERRALRRLAWAAYRATHITFLGAGVGWREGQKPDAFDVASRDEKARVLGLEGLSDVGALAAGLALDLPTLRWFAYHREVDTGSHYRRWHVAKRDGSPRVITAPKARLKAAQRWLLRNVIDKLPVHAAAHGFLASRSIVTNARAHAGADVVVKVDVKDFFPTVTWRRVKGLLRKAGLPESNATLVALLTTEAPRQMVEFRGRRLFVAQGPRALPQGAPTSPAITNALCLRLDRRLAGLARTFGFRYTRYADDLTFSWSRPARADAHGRPPIGALLRGVKIVLRGEGFVMHPTKTRVVGRGASQRVTGLVINRAGGKSAERAADVRVPRELRRQVRAALHNRERGKPGKDGESLAQLRGLASFVFMVDPAAGAPLLARIAKLEAVDAASKGTPAPLP